MKNECVNIVRVIPQSSYIMGEMENGDYIMLKSRANSTQYVRYMWKDPEEGKEYPEGLKMICGRVEQGFWTVLWHSSYRTQYEFITQEADVKRKKEKSTELRGRSSETAKAHRG
eukprot:TRINITY_DN4174_c0_g1_i1.p3 TRINITY_DN4174_c0_g1~~TRINITY_DN4174_c0_g1_i1.p3  ORF type:complete len:114 (-),score=40.81 TRINITY_DN4174_c0_g1_i1:2-343(-)